MNPLCRVILLFVLVLCVGVTSASGQLLEVTATDYAFRAPNEIPSGWTTVRLSNEGEEAHFILLTRLPEGKTLEDYTSDVGVPFNEVWYKLRDGGIDQGAAGEALGQIIPEWYWTATFKGGPALVAPGRIAETVVDLEPGTYVLECYMKTPEGEFHWMEGMIRALQVTDTPSGALPPNADIHLTMTNFEMAVEGDLSPGAHTVAVRIEENPEVGFGHNVHVARLAPEANAREVVRWMNAFEIDGLRPPAPATFLGGTQMMPPGETAYFSLNLEPGRYLFVSEYTGSQGVLQEIVVGP